MLQAYNNSEQREATSPSEDDGVVEQRYNIRNFWLFNPKSEELLISLLCPKVRAIRFGNS